MVTADNLTVVENKNILKLSKFSNIYSFVQAKLPGNFIKVFNTDFIFKTSFKTIPQ